MIRFLIVAALLLSITKADPMTADCMFTESNVQGIITFNQDSEEEGISVMAVSLSGSGIGIDNAWHIHEWSVQNDCASTGGHYNPIPNYGELSSRYGDITNPWVKTFNASENKLSGDHSIVGRSIVIHNGAARIACCTIGIRSGDFSPAPPVLVEDTVVATCNLVGEVEGIVQFVAAKVEGQVSSTSVDFPLGSFISVNVTGATGNGYHIHTGAVGPANECGAEYTGGHYNPDNSLNYNSPTTLYGVGELANKHGNLEPDTDYAYIDNAVKLNGPFSVVGRSVVVHGSGDPTQRIACCDITSVTNTPTPSANARSVLAQCSFDVGNATGSFFFSQPMDGSSFGTRIWTSGITITNENEQGEHGYHIHINAPNMGTQSCGDTGAHYSPVPYDGIGPDANGVAWAAGIQYMEIGDLSGKHGKLSPGQEIDYVDGQVALSGPYSVVGRSIVIHSQSSAARIACCTIGLISEIPGPTTTNGEGSTTADSSATSAVASFLVMIVALLVAMI